MQRPILWYFADPMCSWCRGFSPVIETLRGEDRADMKIALVLGGLRHDSAPLTASERDDILHHWRAVQTRTGQAFRFENALPPGFVYDTEPACRAVVAVGGLDPALAFPLLKAIQTAFYAEARDVTQPAVLAELATGLGVENAAFLHAFESDLAHSRTQTHFRLARQVGVRGFPALVMQRNAQIHTVSNGCETLEAVHAAIERCLTPEA